MPRFLIRLVNSEFVSCDEGEYPNPGAAMHAALASAVGIASESILKGEPSTAIELRVEDAGAVVARQVLSLSVSDLMSSGLETGVR